MKIVIAMFSVIVATLLFAIVWNFASAAKMRATFAGKEQEIAQLQESILGLKSEYTSLDNDELIKLKAENEGYVDQNVDNTIDVEVKKIYEETAVEDYPEVIKELQGYYKTINNAVPSLIEIKEKNMQEKAKEEHEALIWQKLVPIASILVGVIIAIIGWLID